MSFKRDGNDTSWLNKLRERLVSELLACDIPNDEALLTRHGRYACLVCPHRPVLDTLAMLQVHRSGSKHQRNADILRVSRQEVDDLRQKRQHQQHLYTAGTHMANHHAEKEKYSEKPAQSHRQDLAAGKKNKQCLVPSTPYQSKVRKQQLPYQRRAVIQLDTEGIVNEMPMTSKGEALPGLSDDSTTQYKTISEYTKLRGLNQEQQRVRVQPYISQKLAKNSVTQTVTSADDILLRPARETRKAAYWRRRQSAAESLTETKTKMQNKQEVLDNMCPPSLDSPATFTSSSAQWKTVRESRHVPHHKMVQAENKQSKRSQTASHVPSALPAKSAASHVQCSSTESQRVKRYLEARGSGWKKDLSGQWVKDEQAEFDSDEEPPDLN